MQRIGPIAFYLVSSTIILTSSTSRPSVIGFLLIHVLFIIIDFWTHFRVYPWHRCLSAPQLCESLPEQECEHNRHEPFNG